MSVEIPANPESNPEAEAVLKGIKEGKLTY
jgi:hypothetical protein